MIVIKHKDTKYPYKREKQNVRQEFYNLFLKKGTYIPNK